MGKTLRLSARSSLDGGDVMDVSGGFCRGAVGLVLVHVHLPVIGMTLPKYQVLMPCLYPIPQHMRYLARIVMSSAD